MAARDRRLVPPRIEQCRLSLLIPGRRLLPLRFSGEASTVRAGEGVGLEPGDVDDRSVRMQWLKPREAPLRPEVGRPALWSCDVVVLLPGPTLVGPPLT